MKKPQWDEGLRIGVGLIDAQHREWFARLQAVAEAVESRLGVGHVGRTLGFLLEYTDFHFATEENHMALNQYPELDAHRARHAELRETLRVLVRDFEEEGATPALSRAVHEFLGRWLEEHIRTFDRAFGGFLEERGVAIPEREGS